MTAIHTLAQRVLAGDNLSFDEAVSLLSRTDYDPYELFVQANQVRAAHFGRRVHLCSIVNAKMGGCPEDCSFCSQAARYHTGVEKTGFLSTEELLEASRQAASYGSSGIGLVTATRGFRVGNDLEKIAASLEAITQEGKIEAHASLGLMGKDELARLKKAGLTEFNHNLETGRGFFPKICSTHTYDDRIATIKAAKELGIRTCVGGIFGMGEDPIHRAELAFTLKELDVDEVPINFLVQVDGTPLYEQIDPLPPLQLLSIISVFRLVLPNKNIFMCAGRKHLGDLQSLLFFAGASGLMIGDFLTTVNRSVAEDLKMLSDLGFETTTCGKPLPAAENLVSMKPKSSVARTSHSFSA
jgi:biotin synthase